MSDAIIHVVARPVPRPDKAKTLAAAIKTIPPEVRRGPGCLVNFGRETRDAPGTTMMVEVWIDQAARALPQQVQLVLDIDEVLDPLEVSP